MDEWTYSIPDGTYSITSEGCTFVPELEDAAAADIAELRRLWDLE